MDETSSLLGHSGGGCTAASVGAPKRGRSGPNAAAAPPKLTMSPHVIESARMVEQYRQAKAAAAAAGKNTVVLLLILTASSCRFKQQRPLAQQQNIGISVELTSLFDPPLLSEWTPGVDIGISYDDDDKCEDENDCDDGNIATNSTNATLNAAEVNDALNKLVRWATVELKNETNVATAGASIGESIRQLFGTTSADSLVEYLPSRTILHATTLAATNIDTKDGQDAYSYVSIGIMSLTLLAETCRTESMGRHILSVLTPVLLSSQRATAVEYPKDNALSESNRRRLLQRLSDSLINYCHLGELSKGELLKLVDNNGVRGETTSDMMDELMIYLGRSYHGWRQRG